MTLKMALASGMMSSPIKNTPIQSTQPISSPIQQSQTGLPQLPSTGIASSNGVYIAPNSNNPIPGLGAQTGSVLGANTGFAIDNLQPPTIGQGSANAGGGYYGGGGSASNSIIDLINQKYNNAVADLNQSQSLAQQEADRARGAVTQSQQLGTTQAQQQRDANKANARSTYNDLVTQSRARVRASGTGASSGFLDITSRLDQQLQQNLSAADTNADNYVQKITLTAQAALNEIETSLQRTIASIESDRRKSALEKDQMITEAQINAAENYVKAQQWAASQASKIQAEQEKAYQRQVLSAYASDLASAQNGSLPGFTVQDVKNKYLPVLTQTGQIGLPDIQGFITPTQQGLTDDEKLYYTQSQQNARSLADILGSGMVTDENQINNIRQLLGY